MIKITSLPFICKSYLSLGLILVSLSSWGQSLTFNFSNNTVDAENIAQTIVSGGDTFELSVEHVENIDVDFFANGDSIFFVEFGFSTTDPYVISLSRNGEPILFSLEGIEYDALVEAQVSLVNQSGDFITENVGLDFGFNSLPIENVANATEISLFEIQTENPNAFENIGFTNISVQATETLSLQDNVTSDVVFYPNPSSGLFTINSDITDLNTIEIYDLNGRLVTSIETTGRLDNQTVDMRSVLSQGVYLVTLISTNAAITKRIIVN